MVVGQEKKQTKKDNRQKYCTLYNHNDNNKCISNAQNKRILYASLHVLVDFMVNLQSVVVGMLCDRASVVNPSNVGPACS